jgi:hypothetical protein
MPYFKLLISSLASNSSAQRSYGLLIFPFKTKIGTVTSPKFGSLIILECNRIKTVDRVRNLGLNFFKIKTYRFYIFYKIHMFYT